MSTGVTGSGNLAIGTSVPTAGASINFIICTLGLLYYPPLLGEDRHCKVCWLEYKLSGIWIEPPLFTFVFRTSLLAFRLRAEQLELLDLLRNKDFIQLPTFISTTMYSFRGTVPMLHLSTASWIFVMSYFGIIYNNITQCNYLPLIRLAASGQLH